MTNDTCRPLDTDHRVSRPARAGTVADDIVTMLHLLGIRLAFGVSGGGIAPLWTALLCSVIETLHFRNEAGASFAATEASVAANGPVAVFCTTGPGITNAVTGLASARVEGAKVVLLSPRTSPAQRGRFAVQETSGYAMASADLFGRGWLFDDVFLVESADELPRIAVSLAQGLGRRGAYVAHLSVPVNLQKAPAAPAGREALEAAICALRPAGAPAPGPTVVDEVVQHLARDRFAVWVGHGARHASDQVRALVAATGAPVLATPRGKGIVAEDDGHYLGVTGIGGHESVARTLGEYGPERILVLGSRLSEPSSGWDDALVPPKGFIHVDLDPSVPGAAFPGAPVMAIQADVAELLDAVLARSGELTDRSRLRPFCTAGPIPPAATTPATAGTAPLGAGCVRPDALMAVVQRVVVDRTDIPVLVEPGSAMGWATHYLTFRHPGRYRMTGLFGSMGHMVCGALGAAAARGGPVVCVTGDGSMLMNNEVNTAVAYRLPVIWIVLNDARYAMVEAGMAKDGWDASDGWPARFPECDFAAVAIAMGADGVQVSSEADLDEVLTLAVAAETPFVVDVVVDRSMTAPVGSRFRTLEQQGR